MRIARASETKNQRGEKDLNLAGSAGDLEGAFVGVDLGLLLPVRCGCASFRR